MSVPSWVPAGVKPLVQRLADFKSREWPDPFDADHSFRSAVLVLLTPDENGTDLDIVLTVRTTKMRRNAGEVACPGGALLAPWRNGQMLTSSPGRFRAPIAPTAAFWNVILFRSR